MSKKRAYVIYCVGQKYIDGIAPLVEFLLDYSVHEIHIHFAEGTINYVNSRIKTFPIHIEYKFDFNTIPYHKPSAIRNCYLMLYKPQTCLTTLTQSDVDECLYLDTDIVPSPNIDRLFDKYANNCTTYPLLSKYPPNNYLIEGRPLVLDKVLNLLKISRKAQSVPSLCAGMMMANKNCVSFLKTWVNFVHSNEFIDAFIRSPGVEDKDMCQFTDEIAGNALIWVCGGTEYLPPMVWTGKSQCVEYVLNLYKTPTVVGLHPDYPKKNYGWTPDEYAEPYVCNASVFPLQKEDLLAFHAIKKPEEYSQSFKYMRQLF